MRHDSKDELQTFLVDYAASLAYAQFSEDVVHVAKVRMIDTFSALLGGYSGKPCRIARNLAAQVTSKNNGASVIGAGFKTSPEMAAFVNGSTARYVEMNDVYHRPGSFGGHPSDVVMPVFAAAEHVNANGRDLITALVLAYEIYMRITDEYQKGGFDHTNFCCLASAVAAGKLFGLNPEQMSHCISMAVVPNNSLRQVRLGHLSMYKAVASGQAGRAGLFAALQARAGMEGPHLPFEGEAGWFDHVAKKRIVPKEMGGSSVPFRIKDTLIKQRSSCATTISSILAAEKVAPIRDLSQVKKVTVEVYKSAKEGMATGEHHWNPDSRETADHSIPYVTAATLIDGTLTPASFEDDHLKSPELRALLSKIEVISNDEFTHAYKQMPVEHRTRITVETTDGKRSVGEAGGKLGDLSEAKSDAQVERKFQELSESLIGPQRVKATLDLLWDLDHLDDLTLIAQNTVALAQQ